MDIELDTEKDAIIRAKHGFPLALGLIVLENRVGDVADSCEYVTEFGTEHRRLTFGDGRSTAVRLRYTMRGETYRLMSVRKANKREQRTWRR